MEKTEAEGASDEARSLDLGRSIWCSIFVAFCLGAVAAFFVVALVYHHDASGQGASIIILGCALASILSEVFKRLRAGNRGGEADAP